MSLLEDIQSAAVDSNSDLGTILRKCKLLAARLGSKTLENWLIYESNGYPLDVSKSQTIEFGLLKLKDTSLDLSVQACGTSLSL